MEDTRYFEKLYRLGMYYASRKRTIAQVKKDLEPKTPEQLKELKAYWLSKCALLQEQFEGLKLKDD